MHACNAAYSAILSLLSWILYDGTHANHLPFAVAFFQDANLIGDFMRWFGIGVKQ